MSVVFVMGGGGGAGENVYYILITEDVDVSVLLLLGGNQGYNSPNNQSLRLQI